MGARKRLGFTLIELLVVIAIIGILLGLMLAAVQYARESARRIHCSSNLRQIGLAIHSYEAANKRFPHGATRGSHSFLIALLPYMEQHALFDRVDPSLRADQGVNLEVSKAFLTSYRCPSEFAIMLGPQGASYAGNFGTGVQTYGYNGFFRREQRGPIRSSDITDGLSNTAAVSEILFAHEQFERRRLVFRTPTRMDGRHELDQFASACASMTMGDTGTDAVTRGISWNYGDAGRAWYNHILGPNHNSCTNNGLVQEGAFSAASFHAGGVNWLAADGSVHFAPDLIAIDVWRRLGSRTDASLSE
jgi:prepilin-type N-terminal cleavage/methylation domain-containing protein